MTKSTYLVGGAVRDTLLGVPVKDRDYVVIGSTPQEMISLGYSKVGADFPVFLHPETGEEYALARRERKTGSGYLGFQTDFSANITLEEDLGRRDFTICSMAMNTDGTIIDPFGGQDDLRAKILRHISDDAFIEDPVRVLRLARFMARFGPEWEVAPETEYLISTKMRSTLNELTAERVWKEMSRSLTEKYPRLFFDTLARLNVLDVLFPEVHVLSSCQENPKWHPEGNTYEHTMLVLEVASKLNPGSLEAAFFALTHDFGKSAVPAHKHPKFYGHAELGVPLVNAFCDRLKVDAKLKKHARQICRFHMHMHLLDKMKAATFVKMFDQMDAWRDPEVIDHLVQLGMADHRGRLGFHDADIGQLFKLEILFSAASCVKFADLNMQPPPVTKPEKIKDAFFKMRTDEVARWLK